MPRKIDLTGKRFTRLVVLREIPERKDGVIIWECKCDCGKTVYARGQSLREGHYKSCGCLKTERFTKMAKEYPRKKNSPEKNRLYNIWQGMRRRTMKPNRQNYRWYGARGIRVCDEWSNSFSAFEKWAMSHGYNNDLSIDRIDPDGNYCPDNCRWASKTEQSRNRCNTRYFTYLGKTKTVSEWADITGIPYTTLIKRIDDGRIGDVFTHGRCLK